MDEVKVNYHKTQIDLMSFEIDLLDDSSKIEVIKHLEETLSLLKIGSRHLLSPKKIKLENEASKTDAITQIEEAVKEETLAKSSVPQIVDEDAIRAMYEGLIPTCNECGAKFPSLGALDNHSKLHDEHNLSPAVTSKNVKVKTENRNKNANDFNCKECGKYCFSKKNLLRHRVIHTDKYQCNTCGKSFYDSTSLVSHNKSEDNCLRYMNTLMNQTVKRESEDLVQEHIEDATIEQELNTTEEAKNYDFGVEEEETFENSLTEAEDVTMEEAINVENLNESKEESSRTVTEDDDSEASQIKTTIDKRQCPNFLHKFSSMSRIRYHQQNPENCKKFLSKESSPKTSENDLLLQKSNEEELSTVSTEDEEKREKDNVDNPPNEKAGLDEKEVEESSNIDEHHMMDSSSQDESMEESTNSAIQESSLNVKKFTCKVCQKMFSANNTLITHMNIHSGKFICKLCQHRFSTQRQLLKHNEDPSNCKKYLDKKSKDKPENTKIMEEMEPPSKIEDEMKQDAVEEKEPSLEEQSLDEEDDILRNEDYAENDTLDNNSSAVDREGSEVPVDKTETETKSSSKSNKFQCPECLHNFSSLLRLRGHRENPQKCKRFLKKLKAKSLETENLVIQDQSLQLTAELSNQEDKSISFEEENDSAETIETNENSFTDTKDDPKENLDQSGLVDEAGLIRKERRKFQVIICEICSIEINFHLKKSHEKGLVHQEMLIQKCLGISKGLKDPFICRVCSKSYANPKAFHNHMTMEKKKKKEKEENFLEETETSQSETSFNCLECDAVLTSNEAFASHMSLHEEEADMDTSEDNISEENVQTV